MKRILLTTPDGSWEVIPVTTSAGIMLFIITAYILFRAVLFMIAMVDVYSGALKKWVFFTDRSKWTPGKDRLRKSAFHCIIGGVLLAVYLNMGGYFGWIEFVEQQ